MDPLLQQIAEPLLRTGPQHFARWNGEVFLSWCAGPGQQLWKSLSHDAPADRRRTMDAVLRFVQEAVGRGYLTSPAERPCNLVEALLREKLPEWLPSTPVAQRMPLLATVWNVTEGVAREAAWLDQYLLARLGELTDAAAFPEQVAKLLRPVVEPLPPIRWQGPYRVAVFDMRPSDDEFLPGEMQWIAPRMLCVHDRRRPTNLGILLSRGEPAAAVGTLGEAQPYQDNTSLPSLHWEVGGVRLNKERVELPLWEEPFTFALASSGFLVVSTVNSQRLWIVESMEASPA